MARRPRPGIPLHEAEVMAESLRGALHQMEGAYDANPDQSLSEAGATVRHVIRMLDKIWKP
jgi:hypothetical protein